MPQQVLCLDFVFIVFEMQLTGRTAIDMITTVPFLLFTWCAVILPSSLSSWVSSERDQKTLELVQITKIASLGFIWGQFLTFLILALLIISLVLPFYTILYFFGGFDIGIESSRILLIFLAASVVGSWMLLLSSLPMTNLLRNLLVLLSCAFSFFLWGLIYMITHSGTSRNLDIPFYCLGFLATLALIWTLIRLAAQVISPPGECHWKSTRFLAFFCVLAFFTILFLAQGKKIIEEANTGTSFLFLAIAGIITLANLFIPIHRIKNLYAPYYRPGILSRFSRLFLAPPWASGSLFALLLAFLSWSIFLSAAALYGDLSRASFTTAKIRALTLFLLLVPLFISGVLAPIAFVKAYINKSPMITAFCFGLWSFFGVIASIFATSWRLSGGSIAAALGSLHPFGFFSCLTGNLNHSFLGTDSDGIVELFHFTGLAASTVFCAIYVLAIRKGFQRMRRIATEES